jgi:hypothetical protein
MFFSSYTTTTISTKRRSRTPTTQCQWVPLMHIRTMAPSIEVYKRALPQLWTRQTDPTLEFPSKAPNIDMNPRFRKLITDYKQSYATTIDPAVMSSSITVFNATLLAPRNWHSDEEMCRCRDAIHQESSKSILLSPSRRRWYLNYVNLLVTTNACVPPSF